MKYYGIKQKRIKEDVLYTYAKRRTQLMSMLPGRRKEFWRECYEGFDNTSDMAFMHSNSIPENGELNLDCLIISDLVRREDIHRLKSGVGHLIKKSRSNRFGALNIDSIDEIYKRLDEMDSTRLSWYENLKCGFFEVSGHNIRKKVDYYKLNIHNINSAFLSVEIVVFLTDEMKNEIATIVNSNYSESRGYARTILTEKSHKCGTYEYFSVIHYNNDFLKSDRIYEIISCLEWELLEELSTNLPLVLHKKGIIPPRIELYLTNIDYHDKNTFFWNSIGISSHEGQFIDERQKMFFDCSLSGRYESNRINNRLIYIVKDDKKEIGRFESVKDDAYQHMRSSSVYYFEMMFLSMLAKNASLEIIKSRRRLDKIKLQRNRLIKLLKLKYNLSRKIDDYERYTRDNKWNSIQDNLMAVYVDNIKLTKNSTSSYSPIEKFIGRVLAEKNKIDDAIHTVYNDYEDKRAILQNLSEYKNNRRNMIINAFMLIIAIITLYFVVFPEKAVETANMLREFATILENCKNEILLKLKLK